jgi:nicotinamidase-related amidase
MAAKNEDLHGNAPDKSAVALLLIDVINDMEFEGGAQLLEHALPMADNIAALKKRAREHDIPVVYVNDNFGKWQSDFKKTLEHVLHDGCRGKPVAEKLQPAKDDYFVLKPKHSGFFSTTLEILLEYLEAKTLILTGIAGNNCVLFTANDAYMRDFHLIVPADCVVSIEVAENEYALKQIQKVLKADISPATEIDFERLRLQAAGNRKPAADLRR